MRLGVQFLTMSIKLLQVVAIGTPIPFATPLITLVISVLTELLLILLIILLLP